MQLNNKTVINKKHFKQGGVRGIKRRIIGKYNDFLDMLANKLITNRNMSILMGLYFTVLGIEITNTVYAEVPVEIVKAEELSITASTTPMTAISEMTKPDPYCNPSTNPEVNSLINKYFTDCKEARTIWAIAQSESGGKQLAINKENRNKSWDCGWLQTNTIHRNKGESYQSFCDRMMHLENNIKMAKHIKDVQGWTAWVNYNNECYKAFMTTPASSVSTCKK